MEGTKDRPGNNFLIKFLRDRLWNYNVGKACLKIQLINKTGIPSVYGEVVKASATTDMAFGQSEASNVHPIGICAEGGVADGSLCWIIIYGIAEVLLKDATLGAHGNWVYTSDVAGRADATLADPPGGGVPELDIHMQEIGHCLQTVGAGTDVLCTIMVHFN